MRNLLDDYRDVSDFHHMPLTAIFNRSGVFFVALLRRLSHSILHAYFTVIF